MRLLRFLLYACPKLSSQAQHMQGVLLDQFGVLHDGKVAFPAAIEAVKEMASASKKVYILSNSSRRSATALQNISSLGFPAECFAGADP